MRTFQLLKPQSALAIKSIATDKVNPVYAVIINTMEPLDAPPGIWPEIMFCANYVHAHEIMSMLNALSYRETAALLAVDEPYITKSEVDRLWLDLKSPQFTVVVAPAHLAEKHVARIEPSIRALSLLLPPIMCIELV